MKSPGVEVRPIKQASGQSDFNEVYFTDVRIPDSQRLGAVGDGWNVSLTTLMNERMSIGAGVATGFPELFEYCNSLMLDDGPAIENPGAKIQEYLDHRQLRAVSGGMGAHQRFFRRLLIFTALNRFELIRRTSNGTRSLVTCNSLTSAEAGTVAGELVPLPKRW
jgi:hypothetical protein